MSRSNSPGYPNFSLAKAISLAHAIYSEDRRNPIDRVVAAKHVGYTSLNGAAEKSLGTLSHYNLLEKAGKGQVRVSQTAVDILHPESSEGKKAALRSAAFNPQIFNEIKDRFTDVLPSEEALKSWLMRQEFLDRAIVPVTRAFLDTCQYLEQEKAFESGGPSMIGEQKSQPPDDAAPEVHRETKFGGAKVGDLIQWESDGTLQFEQPRRVRLVTENGDWLAVEGSETGIPMNEAIVHTKAPAAPLPSTHSPTFPETKKSKNPPLSSEEREWLRGPLSKDTSYRLVVSGDLGPKEIGKLIKLLEAQKAVLSDDDEDPIG